jgi:hypothetical protein
MFSALGHGVRCLGQRFLHAIARRLVTASAPSSARMVVGTLADLPRSKGDSSPRTPCCANNCSFYAVASSACSVRRWTVRC